METDASTGAGWDTAFTTGESDQFEATLTKDQTYELHMDMHWSDPETAKDFSIIAQGQDGGDIEITHWKGLKTAKFPIITR